MDANTILLITFAVMMLFCCGGLGLVFSRGGSKDDSQTSGKKSAGGCCH